MCLNFVSQSDHHFERFHLKIKDVKLDEITGEFVSSKGFSICDVVNGFNF